MKKFIFTVGRVLAELSSMLISVAAIVRSVLEIITNLKG